jgi:hypothetical protein
MTFKAAMIFCENLSRISELNFSVCKKVFVADKKVPFLRIAKCEFTRK